MASAAVDQHAETIGSGWAPGLTRVPYWVYQDPAVLRAEQKRIFEGPAWHYLCLEADIPKHGDYRVSCLGEMPVIAVRGEAGEIHAFENRCAHRGALIAFEDAGTVKDFTCAYHAWRYDLRGNLCSVAFQRGVGGKGGMAESFRLARHGPRKLRIADHRRAGVRARWPPDAPDLVDYLGPDIAARIRRVLHKPVEVIGRFIQPLPNNWKLYVENVKDTYHASLLHLFFTTFNITRFSQAGGVTVSRRRRAPRQHDDRPARSAGQPATRTQGLRSDSGFRLHDPSLLDAVDEFGDNIQLQILTVFPSMVLQQIHNCLAVRQIVPRGVDAMDLHWTYIGFADDTKEMRRRRLKQANLVGPAGYVSMEDGCIGGFVQRGIAAAGEELSVVEMGGATAESQADARDGDRGARLLADLSRLYGAVGAMDAPALLFRLAALNSDYAACIDADRLEDWPDFFTRRLPLQDHHRRELSARVCGRGDLRRLAGDAARSRGGVAGGQHLRTAAYRHIVGMPRVAGEDAGVISAETPFLVVRTMRDGRMDIFAAGRYLDRVVDARRRAALRRAHRGLRQPALRYAAGDPAVMRGRGTEQEALSRTHTQCAKRRALAFSVVLAPPVREQVPLQLRGRRIDERDVRAVRQGNRRVRRPRPLRLPTPWPPDSRRPAAL